MVCWGECGGAGSTPEGGGKPPDRFGSGTGFGGPAKGILDETRQKRTMADVRSVGRPMELRRVQHSGLDSVDSGPPGEARLAGVPAGAPGWRHKTIGEPPIFFRTCPGCGGGVQWRIPCPFSTCDVCFLSIVARPRLVGDVCLPGGWGDVSAWDVACDRGQRGWYCRFTKTTLTCANKVS